MLKSLLASPTAVSTVRARMHLGRKKVLIIGAGGRMGAALARRYAANHQVIAFRRRDLDVLHLDHITPALAALDFDCVIYTAGITSVDYCEDHPNEARLTNTDAPRIIAEVCKAQSARFIHISTDYVFDGNEPAPRAETDPAIPISVYGQTKLDGEKAVLSVSPDFLVIRVSWLFGPDKPSFPDMVLQRALQNDHVEAIADKWSCPTYSEDLAVWIEPMIEDHRYCGLLHLSNSISCSWLEYGQTTLDLAIKIGLPLRATQVDALSRVDFPTFRAKRPEHTSFDTTKFQHLSGIVPRPWQAALEDYLRSQYCVK